MKETEADRGADMTLKDIDLDTLTPEAAMELLCDGERMDRATFHELYKLTPEKFKAELIGGVVFVTCPMKNPRAFTHAEVMLWLGNYKMHTPGVRATDNGTAIIDVENEPQPDAALVIAPECGGQTTIDADDYAEGAPELVVEIADSSAPRDLGPKRRAYERAGVQEYIVVNLAAGAVRWVTRQEDRFEERRPDDDGLFRSRVFPGLWLDPAALLAGDSAAVNSALQRGLDDPAHAEFVKRLADRRANPT
jgi:Uma2 family endonuclease